MTVDEVKAKVFQISKIASDDEAAHIDEDDLHQSVLAAIRDGTCEDPVGCAREALKSLDIKFARWCA